MIMKNFIGKSGKLLSGKIQWGKNSTKIYANKNYTKKTLPKIQGKIPPG